MTCYGPGLREFENGNPADSDTIWMLAAIKVGVGRPLRDAAAHFRISCLFSLFGFAGLDALFHIRACPSAPPADI